MAVSRYQEHRPRETTVSVSVAPDFSGDWVGSGVADDVEINAAVAFVSGLGGGEVKLLQGTFDITAPIVDTGVDGVTISGMGESTVLRVGDGADVNAIELTVVSGWVLELFKVEGNSANQTVNQQLVSLTTCTDCRVERLWVTDAKDVDPADAVNIFLFDPLRCVVSDCTVWASENHGIRVETTAGTTLILTSIHHNRVFSCVGSGLSNAFGKQILYTDNICNLNNFGIETGGFHAIISNNHCVDNTHTNIQCAAFEGVVDGNICEDTVTFRGITVSGASIVVSNNIIVDSNTAGIYVTSPGDGSIIIGNSIKDSGGHGVEVVAGATNVTVLFNKYSGNALGPILDNGTNTALATISIPLIQGTTFISTAGEAWGWEINADPEFALGIGWLPFHLQGIVRIRIIGVGLAAPGAGNEMRAQFTGEAATFDEVFTVHSIDVADLDSEETNFAIDDVIHWVLDASDDADIANIIGGDRLQIKVLHEGAGGGSIATDAIVDSIQVEYV